MRALYEALKKKIPNDDSGLSPQIADQIAVMKRDLMSKDDDIIRLKRETFRLEAELEENVRNVTDRPHTPTLERYREKVREKESVYVTDTKRRKDSDKDVDIDDGKVPEPFVFSSGMLLTLLHFYLTWQKKFQRSIRSTLFTKRRTLAANSSSRRYRRK